LSEQQQKIKHLIYRRSKEVIVYLFETLVSKRLISQRPSSFSLQNIQIFQTRPLPVPLDKVILYFSVIALFLEINHMSFSKKNQAHLSFPNPVFS
jgi:hypothetical protein